MENFLKQFSTLPKEFIDDFFAIAKEEYDGNDLIIDFGIICKWLNVISGNLRKILLDNFEDGYDYTIERKTKTKKSGGTVYYKVTVTPNCFKELCMISQTAKAKEVRKYFIEMEKIVKRYYENIQQDIHKEFGLVKANQKPKVCPHGGILYIIKANTTTDTLYKIGKTKNLCNRLKTYNSSNANDIEPLFIIPVKDIDSAENCVKSLIKQFQYRKYKEVYEININVLKKLMEQCSDLANSLKKIYEQNKSLTVTNIKKLKQKGGKYFIYIDRNTEGK